jgi:hypothetical protein
MGKGVPVRVYLHCSCFGKCQFKICQSPKTPSKSTSFVNIIILNQAGGFMPSKFFAIIILTLTFLLAGCGNEGPFGNTPGPKKPSWRFEYGKLQE